jgi:hypothetical protein
MAVSPSAGIGKESAVNYYYAKRKQFVINVKGRPGNPEAALRMVSGRKCRPRSLYRLIETQR